MNAQVGSASNGSNEDSSEAAPSLLVFDGANLLFRAYFAIPNLTNSVGMPTNALYGFTSMVLKLLRDEAPKYAAIVFDTSDPTHRDELFPEYKANRPDMPDDLRVQLPYLERIAAGLRLPFLKLPGAEADDIMATLARRAQREGMRSCLVTSDKDMAQLVGDGITMLDTMAGRRYGPDDVVAKWGVRPEQMGDYLALVGDSVDNVPGVRGVGAKTAAKLLQEYQSIPGIYAALDEQSASLRSKLEAGAEQLELSRQLVALKEDVAIDAEWADMALGEFDRPALAALFGELGFKGLTREFTDTAHAAQAEFRIVRSEEQWEAELATLAKADPGASLYVQAFWNHPQPSRGRWVGMALSTEPSLGGAYLALDQLDAKGTTAERITTELLAAVRARSLQLVGHDLKRLDVAIRWAASAHSSGLHGIPRFDVQLASYCADPGRYRHDLANIAIDRAQVAVEPPKGLLDRDGSVAVGTPSEAIASYAASVLHALCRTKPVLRAELRDTGLGAIWEEIEAPLADVLAEMEFRGVRVDSGALNALSESLANEISALETKIHAAAGRAFSIGSPKQLGEVLFDELGLPVKKRTKTGPSTDSSVLEALADEHPIAADVLEWRSRTKLRNTYANVLPKLVVERTGRIHTTFNQAISATGRLSSSDPNLQAVPVRTPAGRQIRAAFVPSESHVLISADYSQVELRLLAHLAGAEKLIDAFQAGADIHRATAAELFDVTPDQVDATMRTRAKAINFGILYGMGATRLAAEQKINRKEAQAFIERYFDRYPAIKGYLDSTLEEARIDGEVRTLLGRRRALPDLNSSNRMAQSAAERMAINTPIQGTAADLVKLAMVRLRDALVAVSAEARIVLQVHDELVVEAPAGQAEAVAACMKSVMQGVHALRVPLEVHVHWATNWSDAH